jgi:hypothetical protein
MLEVVRSVHLLRWMFGQWSSVRVVRGLTTIATIRLQLRVELRLRSQSAGRISRDPPLAEILHHITPAASLHSIGMPMSNHQDILSASTARLVASYQSEARRNTTERALFKSAIDRNRSLVLLSAS